MSKPRLRTTESIRRQFWFFVIATSLAISFTTSLAHHFIPGLREGGFVTRFIFVGAIILFQIAVFDQAIKRLISPRFEFINSPEKFTWVFLPVLLGLIFISSIGFSLPTIGPNNTLEIRASNPNTDKTIWLRILEIRDPEGKKIHFRQVERQGWELRNGRLLTRQADAWLKYKFYGKPGNHITILFFSTASLGQVTIRVNDHQYLAKFPKDNNNSNSLETINVEASSPINSERLQILLFYGADFWVISFFITFLSFFWLESTNRKLDHPIYVLIIFLGFCYLGTYFWNNLLPLIDTNAWQFRFPPIFPPYHPVGIDFRGGVYIPVKELFLNLNLNIYANPVYYNVYPPLSNVIYAPYLLFDENKAYLVHIFVLLLANVCCLVLATVLARKYFFSDPGLSNHLINIILFEIFVGTVLNLLASYPFLFSIERGNVDIFALAFSLGSIWILLKSPDRIWWQVLLLSVAVHMKIYPVFLFALLFYKNRFRIVLPSLIVNLVFLFILGPANAIAFLKSLQSFVGQMQVSLLNHSGYAFASAVVQSMPQFSDDLPMLRTLFTYVPLILWAVAGIKLAFYECTPKNIVLGLMVTIPLMEVFPRLSNDYKLVITFPALLLIMALITNRYWEHKSLIDYLQLFMVLIIMLFIGRSYAFIDPSLTIIQNKYIWEVLLQMLILVNIFQEFHLGKDPVRNPWVGVGKIGHRLSTE